MKLFVILAHKMKRYIKFIWYAIFIIIFVVAFALWFKPPSQVLVKKEIPHDRYS